MAVVTATLRDVQITQGPFDQPTNGIDLRVVTLYFDSAGQDVTSGSDTLDVLTAGTQIAGFIRDGKTYTPRVASLVQPYRTGSTNVFGTVAVTGGAIRLTPTASNFSTAAGITGSNPVDAPFGVSVTCTVV